LNKERERERDEGRTYLTPGRQAHDVGALLILNQRTGI